MGWCWSEYPNTVTTTRATAKEIFKTYSVLESVFWPTYQCFEGRLKFFAASVPTICFSILGTT